MLNFSAEQTVSLLARRRRTRKDVASKPWEWQPPTGPNAAAEGVQSAATSAVGSPSSFVPERNASPVGTDGSYLVLDDSALRANQRSIERHINDDHYTIPLHPRRFLLGGSAGCVFAQIPVATPRWPAIIMTKDLATNSLAVASFRKPSEWRTGRLRVRYWFTSPVASTNNFFIQVNIDAIRTGEVLPGTNLIAASAAIAGPAVINTRMFSGDIYTTTSFGPDDQSFSLRITRLSTSGSDTNANEFHLLEAEVFHVSAVQEST